VNPSAPHTPSTTPPAPPIVIRPAATVILLRDGPGGLEVFMVKRHSQSDVLGGAYVFPGGKVDAADALIDPAQLDQSPQRLHQQLCESDIDAGTAVAIHVAAIREAFEECGVLLAHDLTPKDAKAVAAAAAQGTPFNALLAQFALRLDTRQLRPWSRWVTPERSLAIVGKRFDTRFFITTVPPGQHARHDAHEAVDSVWLRPREAVEQYWAGAIGMAPPQVMSLVHLAGHADVASVLREADARPPCVVRPHIFEADGCRATAYPGDELHPERERVMPGPLRLLLRDGRLEPPGGFDAFWR